MAEENEFNRRDFLKIIAGGGAAIASLKAVPKASASKPIGSSNHQWAMIIDQSKCEGCGYCTLACRAHNDIPPDISWNRVIEACEIDGEKIFLARPCMHCEQAPCVDVCPVKASYYRADGIVMMDYEKCIGCRYCEIACPVGARTFGDLNNPESEVSILIAKHITHRLREDLGTEPRVYYICPEGALEVAS